MKISASKNIVLTVIMIVSSLSSYAQVPQGINYQAIARDGSGDILANKSLPVRITLQTSQTGGTILYVEEFLSVTSNQFGLITLVVGTGSRTGGTAASFSDIDWKAQTVFIKTAIQYPGTNWTEMGTSQIMSVPYAMVAKDVGTLSKLGITSATSNDDALFEVKNTGGQTVFAVYNNAVRAYVGKEVTKGARGGFSVGGYDGSKGVQDYLKVYGDSTRVYVKNQSKGVRGGFAVGGYDGSKGTTGNFMNLTKENYFIGHESGSVIQSNGLYNSIIGYQAGKSLTSGGYNTILGYQAGINVTSGNNNIIIGNYAGTDLTAGIHNTLIGNSAGYHHTDQEYNIMIGTNAGNNVLGSYNSFIGINAGFKIKNGIDNVFLGTNAGAMLEDGSGNTIVGIDAGRSGDWDPYDYHSGFTTSNNTMIGNDAGYSLDVGDGNVFIGYGAGQYEIGTVANPVNNKLYIENSSSAKPLIYGDFSAGQLGINTTTLTKTLNVGGDVSVSGNVTATTINGTLTGNVSGNVTGAVTGNLTGNVTGDVLGNLTGTVNGTTMGKVYLQTSGIVVSVAGGLYDLYWDVSAKTLTLQNTHATNWCWFTTQKMLLGTGSFSYEATGFQKGDRLVATFANNGDACVISFGDQYSGGGYCTVWLQYSSSRLFGNYIKY